MKPELVILVTFSMEKNLSGNLFGFYSQLTVYFEFAVYDKGAFSNNEFLSCPVAA